MAGKYFIHTARHVVESGKGESDSQSKSRLAVKQYAGWAFEGTSEGRGAIKAR